MTTRVLFTMLGVCIGITIDLTYTFVTWLWDTRPGARRQRYA